MKAVKNSLLTLLLSSLFIVNSAAATLDDTASEIQYLLSYIEQSDCAFIRNGSEYDAQEARKHIERKYDYLESRIESTEAFIEYAASKSSFSGRPYRIRCGERVVTSEHWLKSALSEYRSSR